MAVGVSFVGLILVVSMLVVAVALVVGVVRWLSDACSIQGVATTLAIVGALGMALLVGVGFLFLLTARGSAHVSHSRQWVEAPQSVAPIPVAVTPPREHSTVQVQRA